MKQFDVVVCGLGAMGSATTYQLAKRGLRVLGIDRFAPPHPLGSTHGDTRITRRAIGEGLAYVPLAIRSHQLWRDIEAQTGADLLTTNGVLIIASPGVQPHHHGKSEFLETTIAAAGAFFIDHEVLTAAEVGRRFPQFRLVGDERAYYEPGGGFVRPERAVAAQLQLAASFGAVTRVNETLTAYVQGRDGVVVTTTAGRYSCGRLVLAAGPWMGSLLGEPYARDLVVTRQVLQWYAITDASDMFLPDRFPAFIWDCAPHSFYGLPAVDGASGGVKVAVENDDPVRDVDGVVREVGGDERHQVHDAVIRTRLPGLGRDCVKALTCLYTTTPDGDFIIDRHPEHPSVMVLSACSGHGFKHSAAIGEAVAAGIAGEQATVDLSPFSLQRLGHLAQLDRRP